MASVHSKRALSSFSPPLSNRSLFARFWYMRVCVCMCMRVCVRACVLVCVHVHVRACLFCWLAEIIRRPVEVIEAREEMTEALAMKLVCPFLPS